MRGCDNSKIHVSSNFILSTCLLIMFITLQHLKLHCNTSTAIIFLIRDLDESTFVSSQIIKVIKT